MGQAGLWEFAWDVTKLVGIPAVLYLGKLLLDIKSDVQALRIVLVGEQGTNGLRSEVKELRERRHVESNLLHTTVARVDLLEHRADRLEEHRA